MFRYKVIEHGDNNGYMFTNTCEPIVFDTYMEAVASLQCRGAYWNNSKKVWIMPSNNYTKERVFTIEQEARQVYSFSGRIVY